MQHRALASLNPWLLNPSLMGSPYVLVDTGDSPDEGCAQQVADLLNEFDDTAEARWIHLDAEILHPVCSSKEYRRLLGLTDPEPPADPDDASCIHQVLAAFARRGRFVVSHPEATSALANDPNGFRAAIGNPPAGLDPFHLILNPSAFKASCLAPLIADSYLQWAATSSAA